VARILVIDNDPEIGHILRLVLEPRGHEVLFADDGATGLGLARSQHPDVIVLDLMMRVMDGFAVLEHLCAEDGTRDVPVMVLTAATTPAARERCIGLGVLTFITKPFDPYEVAHEIDTVVAGRASA
jgi:CheY-like chemotaxis protein